MKELEYLIFLCSAPEAFWLSVSNLSLLLSHFLLWYSGLSMPVFGASATVQPCLQQRAAEDATRHTAASSSHIPRRQGEASSIRRWPLNELVIREYFMPRKLKSHSSQYFACWFYTYLTPICWLCPLPFIFSPSLPCITSCPLKNLSSLQHFCICWGFF